MKTVFSGEYRKIITRLKKARKAKGYSQIDLAQKLGTSQSYVSKLEQGQVRLDVIQLKKISKILDLDIEEFLK
jgi:transcriptional regulator with XRE-family HTH domain